MKSSSVCGVLVLMSLLSLLNFSLDTRKAEAQTGLDMAIISTVQRQSIYYYNFFNDVVQVVVDVTYKNNGTIDIYVNETDPNAWKELHYGYSLVHESWLSYYLNSGGLSEPALVPPNGYSSLSSKWVQLLLRPGQSLTQTLDNLYVYIGGTNPEPLVWGIYRVYPNVLLEDDNTENNVPWWSSVPYAEIRFVRQGGVGGIAVPVDKLGLLAPYIGLASTIVVAAVAAAIYVKRVKRRNEKQ